MFSNEEQKVIDLAVKGYSNVEIGEKIGKNIETVEALLDSAYKKLGVQNRVQAAALFIKKIWFNNTRNGE